MKLRLSTDLATGALFIALGGFAIIYGSRYAVGTTARMGPGYFPMLISASLVAVVIGGTITWRAPIRFLGADGVWMLDELRGMLPGSASRRARATAALTPQPSPMSDS